MSMIGSNILNKLISDNGLTEPTEILEQLNTELIASLKQNKNEGNDGMDIAICVIDFICPFLLQVKYPGCSTSHPVRYY